MACPRCGARTKAGGQCKRKTCKYAPKCFSHTNVEVAPSSITGAGHGLFAKKPIRAGEIVGEYNFAEQITPQQYQAKRAAGTATHVALFRNQYYDATDVRRTVAGMANRAPTGGRNNLKLTATGRLKATRNIPAGRELFLAYGSAYRL